MSPEERKLRYRKFESRVLYFKIKLKGEDNGAGVCPATAPSPAQLPSADCPLLARPLLLEENVLRFGGGKRRVSKQNVKEQGEEARSLSGAAGGQGLEKPSSLQIYPTTN